MKLIIFSYHNDIIRTNHDDSTQRKKSEKSTVVRKCLVILEQVGRCHNYNAYEDTECQAVMAITKLAGDKLRLSPQIEQVGG
jgi:hypothetical protein